MMENKFRREEFSKALINADHESLKAYKIRRQKDKKITDLETDINKMKDDISEIKTLLVQILNRG
jgi:hypothetical protein